MSKVKLIIQEKFDGKQSLEEVFVSAFQLLQDKMSSIMSTIEQSQDLFCSEKE